MGKANRIGKSWNFYWRKRRIYEKKCIKNYYRLIKMQLHLMHIHLTVGIIAINLIIKMVFDKDTQLVIFIWLYLLLLLSIADGLEIIIYNLYLNLQNNF